MSNQVKNLSGQRIGKLFILSINGKNKIGNTRFLCKCDCGKIVTVDGG